MVVVIIIGIVAAMATPTIVGQMRERRSRDAAQQIAMVYSNARMRAMGRGSAVMVRYNNATGFRMFDSVEGTMATVRASPDCVTAPGSGCLTTNWTVAANQRQVSVFVPPAGITVVGMDPSGTAATDIRICFTPSGRSFASYVAVDPTAAMAGSAQFTVQRGPGMLRRVALLPNGNARLAL